MVLLAEVTKYGDLPDYKKDKKHYSENIEKYKKLIKDNKKEYREISSLLYRQDYHKRILAELIKERSTLRSHLSGFETSLEKLETENEEFNALSWEDAEKKYGNRYI